MKISKELLKGSTALMVLRVIAEEDMYGYRIIREIATRSKDTFKLNEGTLYPILHALEADKLVTAQEREAESGRKRKYYRITKKGLKALEERKEEWELFAQKVNAVLCGL
jgi:PadR family transcriptional regulator PadR